MSGYNPNTKPVWMMLVPLFLGIAAVAVVAGLAWMGLNGFNDYMAELEQMAGQVIGC